MPALRPRLPVTEQGHHRRMQILLGALVLVLAGLAAWWNALDAPFLLDDHAAIVENTTIRDLSNLSAIFDPPRDTSVTGRPVVNLSLALNYAQGGLSPRTYRLTNLLLHLLCAMLLMGVVRRLMSQQTADDSPLPAFLFALLWTLHPLQTAAVTYIVQRAEILGSLFILLSLYAFIRSRQCERGLAWLAISVASCAVGMMAKETVAVAPLLILLADWVFFWKDTKQRGERRAYYLLLFATWAMLALVWAGRSSDPLSPSMWEYARSQPRIILHYLRLAVLPLGQVFDYQWPVEQRIYAIVPQALLLAASLVVTIWAIARRHPAGFASGCVFLILAPSSSFAPLPDLAFEHRMHLPLAGVIAVLGIAAGCLVRNRAWGRKAVMTAALALAVACGIQTHFRNRDFHSEVSIWSDTAAKRPDSPRAHHSLGLALWKAARPAEALPAFNRSLELRPDPEVLVNRGNALLDLGRYDEAITDYTDALRLSPNRTQALVNRASAYFRTKRLDLALRDLNEAEKSDPAFAGTYYNRAWVWHALKAEDRARQDLHRAAELGMPPDPALMQALSVR